MKCNTLVVDAARDAPCPGALQRKHLAGYGCGSAGRNVGAQRKCWARVPRRVAEEVEAIILPCRRCVECSLLWSAGRSLTWL